MMIRLTPEQARAMGLEVPKRRHKFNAKPTTVDNIRFDSKKEAQRYGILKLLERAGTITGLRLQPEFPLHTAGKVLGKYIADFAYFEAGAEVIEDVKSKATKTAVYRLKKKHCEAEYGITIRET